MTIVLATKNKKKLDELRILLSGCAVDLRTLDDFPSLEDIVEDENSFEGNALIKARAVWKHTGQLALADDSGLEVDALGGAPGVYSARYAGAQNNDIDNYHKLLDEIADIPQAARSARFRCVLAVAGSDRNGKFFEKTFAGKCEGRIAFEPKGQNGFGYDPVFFLPEYGLTSAEINAEIKNRISHRADAMNQFKLWLETTLPSPS